MNVKNIVGGGVACFILSAAGWANAQEAPAAASGGDRDHATGVLVQARLQSQAGLLSSVVGGPSFLLGYQGGGFGVGLGLGLNRIGLSTDSDGTSGSLTLFQIMPTALVDVWQSRDGRARANLVGGIGYGRAALSGTATSKSCTVDQLGSERCTTSREDVSAGATFIPFVLGFGGDYYLNRNFALGAELGLQAAFTGGLDQESRGTSRDVDGSANLQFAYGAIRATFVLGN